MNSEVPFLVMSKIDIGIFFITILMVIILLKFHEDSSTKQFNEDLDEVEEKVDEMKKEIVDVIEKEMNELTEIVGVIANVIETMDNKITCLEGK